MKKLFITIMVLVTGLLCTSCMAPEDRYGDLNQMAGAEVEIAARDIFCDGVKNLEESLEEETLFVRWDEQMLDDFSWIDGEPDVVEYRVGYLAKWVNESGNTLTGFSYTMHSVDIGTVVYTPKTKTFDAIIDGVWIGSGSESLLDEKETEYLLAAIQKMAQ